MPDYHNVYRLAAKFRNDFLGPPPLPRNGMGVPHNHRQDCEIALSVGYLVEETANAFDDLDSDTVGPAAEVHTRTAFASQMTLRKYLKNRRAIRRFFASPMIAKALQDAGADKHWIPSRLEKIDRGLTSDRILEVMGANDATVRWAQPEMDRIFKALKLDPFPRNQQADPSVANLRIASGIRTTLHCAREALDELDRTAPSQSFSKNSLATIRVLVRHQSTLSRLIRDFEWELELLNVDTRYVQQVVLPRIASSMSNLRQLNR